MQNTEDFVEQIKNIKLEPGECITSYDFTAFFMSVPVNPALNIVQNKLEQETATKDQTHSRAHHRTSRVLPTKYVFSLPR